MTTNLKEFPMAKANPSSPVSPEEAGLAATIKKSILPSPPAAAPVDTLTETKESDESADKSVHNPVDWLPFGVTTYEELFQLESARDAAFEIAEKSNLFPQMVENIMADDNIVDKSAAVSHISIEFGAFVKAKTSEIGLKEKVVRFATKLSKSLGLSPNETPNSSGGLVIWKQDDTHRFLAIYSNNYRDRETEIISAKSHERFVDMVDSSQYPMPVLRHFHVPGSEWGQVEMVHYDKETGFALAAGYILPGHEHEAEAIMKMDSVPSMSHGMLKSNLKREPSDHNIIIEHQTIELSDLPFEDAANQLMTNFYIIKEADNMGLTDKKRDYLKAVGVKDIDGLEKSLSNGKTLAESLNLDSKDNGGDEESTEGAPVTPDEAPVETAPVAPVAPIATPPIAPIAPIATPDKTPVEAPPAEASPDPVAPDEAPSETTEPVEVGFSDMQTKELIEVLATLMDTFEKKIDEKLAPVMAGLDAIVSKEDELIAQTPLAAFNETIISKKYLSDQSALGSPSALLDGRTSLSKDSPAENDKLQPVTASGNGLVDQLTANIVDGSWQDGLKSKPRSRR